MRGDKYNLLTEGPLPVRVDSRWNHVHNVYDISMPSIIIAFGKPTSKI